MAKVLIIGAGGVSNVVVHKCAQVSEVFDEIVLASRTKSKCDAIAASLSRPIVTEQVDADDVDQMVALIKNHQANAGGFEFVEGVKARVVQGFQGLAGAAFGVA